MASDKIEDAFHDTIWSAANDWMKCERSISEARDLCYAVLKNTSEDDDGALRWMANMWLNNNGRDPRREAKLETQA